MRASESRHGGADPNASIPEFAIWGGGGWMSVFLVLSLLVLLWPLPALPDCVGVGG